MTGSAVRAHCPVCGTPGERVDGVDVCPRCGLPLGDPADGRRDALVAIVEAAAGEAAEQAALDEQARYEARVWSECWDCGAELTVAGSGCCPGCADYYAREDADR